MHALLSLVLALIPLADPAAVPADSQAVQAAAPIADSLPVVAFDDCLDFLLLLDDAAVDTKIVDVVDCDACVLVAAVHTSTDPARGEGTWAVIYRFPPTIFQHSIVRVPFHAEEMK